MSASHQALEVRTYGQNIQVGVDVLEAEFLTLSDTGEVTGRGNGFALQMTFGASQEVLDIKSIINKLCKVCVEEILPQGENLYEQFLTLDIPTIQLKVKALIDGPEMQHLKRLSAKQGIVYIEGNLVKENLPNDVLAIKITTDQQGLPLFLYVGFKSTFASTNFELDIEDITRLSDLVKTHNPTYLKYFNEVENEFKIIESKIKDLSIHEQARLIETFNEKWKDGYELTFTIDRTCNSARLFLKDKYGLISMDNKSTYRPKKSQDPDLLVSTIKGITYIPSIGQQASTLWHQADDAMDTEQDEDAIQDEDTGFTFSQSKK